MCDMNCIFTPHKGIFTLACQTSQVSNHTVFREIFEQVLFLYNSNNQQSNKKKTYSKISLVIERIDLPYLALFDMLIPH